MLIHSHTQAALRGLAVIFILALPLGLTPSAAGATGAEAGTFISSLADRAIESLTSKDTPRGVRIKRFRELFNDHFNVRLIGRFVLGRSWRKASDAEKMEYMKLFEDLMVVTYVDRFSRFAGETLKITSTRAEKGKDSTVFSQITRPTGKPVKVLWRVRSYSESMKVLDVIVEGASMSQTLRSDFSSIIRQNDGKVSGLIEELRKKTVSLKASVQ